MCWRSRICAGWAQSPLWEGWRCWGAGWRCSSSGDRASAERSMGWFPAAVSLPADAVKKRVAAEEELAAADRRGSVCHARVALEAVMREQPEFRPGLNDVGAV